MTALRLAAEQPERVSHLVIAGGFASRLLDDRPTPRPTRAGAMERMRADWPAYLDEFFGIVFSEPHSTKPYEDGVLRGGCGDRRRDRRDGAGRLVRRRPARACQARALPDARDPRRRRPPRALRATASRSPRWFPARACSRSAAAATCMPARDPVAFGRAVRDFVGAAPARSTWVRGDGEEAPGALRLERDRPRPRAARPGDRARDAGARSPTSRSTGSPSIRRPPTSSAKASGVHPITARLANESRHFEAQAGEHDLQAFFALRTMDEVMARNFLVFADLLREEHYDIVIGDEAWEVDYHYHENPELKRQPFVFLTDFVGCLPMEEGNAARGVPLRRPQRRRHRARRALSRGSATAPSSSATRRTCPSCRSVPACRSSATGRGATSPSPAMRCRSIRRALADTDALARAPWLPAATRSW